MISNLYTWIFPAAVCVAAGLFNLSSSVKRKQNPEKSSRNRIIWFSLNISVAFCFITVSAFFVNWSEFIWSYNYLYFAIIIILLFYLGFLLRYVIGLPLVFLLGVIVVFFNIYLQDWHPVRPNGVLGQYRVLTNDKGGITAEVSVFDLSPIFVKDKDSELVLKFELLEIDRSLFFIDPNSYYKKTELLLKRTWSDKFISFLTEKTFILSKEVYDIELTEKSLFLQYNIVLDMDRKKIYIEN